MTDQVARVRAAGWRPIVVTSAAIACGLERLSIEKRPHDMPSLQAAASVGQSALSPAYAEAFARHGIVTSTVLLTRRDTADRRAYLHARDTFDRLLELGVVPIVNENDTDVYKRQRLTKAQATKASSTVHDAYARAIKPVHTSGAVSYTHLDVYKRQPQQRAQIILVHARSQVLERVVRLVLVLHQRVALAAVSYTHLRSPRSSPRSSSTRAS